MPSILVRTFKIFGKDIEIIFWLMSPHHFKTRGYTDHTDWIINIEDKVYGEPYCEEYLEGQIKECVKQLNLFNICYNCETGNDKDAKICEVCGNKLEILKEKPYIDAYQEWFNENKEYSRHPYNSSGAMDLMREAERITGRRYKI